MPFWINENKQSFVPSTRPVADDSSLLLKMNFSQRTGYNIVNLSKESSSNQLLIIITGGAGSGKSFCINGIRSLLQETVKVCAYFGVAAFNIKGQTLHQLFQLPIKGKRAHDLSSPALYKLQYAFEGVSYLTSETHLRLCSKLENPQNQRHCRFAKLPSLSFLSKW